MQKECPTQSILQKIETLQSALFFPEIPDGLLPISILKQVTTDEQENILFSIPWSNYAAELVNTSFPCKMDFFKKGANFHIKINGIATITDEPEMQLKKQLLVKVKIRQVSSFEMADELSRASTKKGILTTFSSAFNKLAPLGFGKALQSLF